MKHIPIWRWALRAAGLAVIVGMAFSYAVWPTPYAYSFDRSARINRFTCATECLLPDGTYRAFPFSSTVPPPIGVSLLADYAQLSHLVRRKAASPVVAPSRPATYGYTAAQWKHQCRNLSKVRGGMSEKQVERLMGRCGAITVVPAFNTGHIWEQWDYPCGEIDMDGTGHVMNSEFHVLY